MGYARWEALWIMTGIMNSPISVREAESKRGQWIWPSDSDKIEETYTRKAKP